MVGSRWAEVWMGLGAHQREAAEEGAHVDVGARGRGAEQLLPHLHEREGALQHARRLARPDGQRTLYSV